MAEKKPVRFLELPMGKEMALGREGEEVCFNSSGRCLHLGKAGSAPADRLKRACGLCVCLAGALMEVMSFGFWYLSNPVHSYVKCWRVHASFGEDLWCLKKVWRRRLMRKVVVLS